MTKLIIFLIRRKLGLKKGQRFKFDNQKSDYDWYYFTSTQLLKDQWDGKKCCYWTRPANVKLNYILSDKCKISKEPSWC